MTEPAFDIARNSIYAKNLVCKYDLEYRKMRGTATPNAYFRTVLLDLQ